MPDPYPWERREDESPRAYAAFCAYRDMGPGRSFDKAAALVAAGEPQNSPKTAPRHWTTWASRYEWRSRATAYDTHLDQRAREANEAEYLRQLQAFREGALRRSTLLQGLLVRQAGFLTETPVRTDIITQPAAAMVLRSLAALSDAITNAQALALGLSARENTPPQEG